MFTSKINISMSSDSSSPVSKVREDSKVNYEDGPQEKLEESCQGGSYCSKTITYNYTNC